MADTFSRAAAVEYAKEFGYEILGESGYIHDVIRAMNVHDFNSVLCSPSLLDGTARQLCTVINEHGGRDCDVFVISGADNKVLKLKRLGTQLKSHGVRQIIVDTLALIRIPATLGGYPLLIDALTITTAMPHTLTDITNSVYQQVAKMHGISRGSVEFNMRTARNHSWSSCELDTLYEIFGHIFRDDNKYPELSEYLSALTAYINTLL